MIISCQQVNILKEAYADGKLESEVRQAVSAHIEGCAPCRERITLAYRVKSGLNQAITLALSSPVPRQKDMMAMQARLERRILATQQMRPAHAGLAAAMLVLFLTSIAIVGAIKSGQVNQIIKPTDVLLIPVPTYSLQNIVTATSKPRIVPGDTGQVTAVPSRLALPSPNSRDAVALTSPIPNDARTAVPTLTTAVDVPQVGTTLPTPPTAIKGNVDRPRQATSIVVVPDNTAKALPQATKQSPTPDRNTNLPVPSNTALPNTISPVVPAVKTATSLPTNGQVSTPPSLPTAPTQIQSQPGEQGSPTQRATETGTRSIVVTPTYTATQFQTRTPQQTPTAQRTVTREPGMTSIPTRGQQYTPTAIPTFTAMPQFTATAALPQVSPTAPGTATTGATPTLISSATSSATSIVSATPMPSETPTAISATATETPVPSATSFPTSVQATETSTPTRQPLPTGTKPAGTATPISTRPPPPTHEPPPTGTRPPPPPTRVPHPNPTPEVTCSPQPTHGPQGHVNMGSAPE